ncbi:MAG: InlB B-repeat-containing protein, partial [Alkalispirochaeta sp.]
PTTMSVSEGGSDSTYTVVLDTEPTADVEISISSGGQVTTDVGALTFTSADWEAPQTVTVTAVDDGDVEGNHSDTVTHSVTSSDGNYDGISAESVAVSIVDNDAPGVSVSPISIPVTEGGGPSSYSVVLTTQPTADVEISVTVTNGEATATPATLTFTTADWDTAQAVTVAAVDDVTAEGPHNDTITHAAASGDGGYDGIAISDVSVSITDNEFTVTYNANGASSGTPPIDPNTYTVGNAVTVESESDLFGPLIQDGITQRFTGWNTESNGSGTTYAPGDTPTPSSTVTLYAQWTTDGSVVGKVGPAGGLVFYDDNGTNFLPTGRYLEAAPVSTEWGTAPWSDNTSATLAPATGIGSGAANTTDIIAGSVTTPYAAEQANALTHGGFSDWFLPSRDELDLMYVELHLNALGSFDGSARYWSSSDSNFTQAWAHNFSTGTQEEPSKTGFFRGRAIRSFGP